MHVTSTRSPSVTTSLLSTLVEKPDTAILSQFASISLPLRMACLEKPVVVLGEFLGRSPRRHVELLDVVGEHAVHVEPAADRGDRLLHHLDPAHGHPGLVAVVVQLRDLVLDQIVDLLGLGRFLHLVLVVVLGARDRPAVLAVVALRPPAVQDAQIQHAVHPRLHPGGAAGLVLPDRVVEPDVGAPREVPGDVDVVVFEEDDSVLELVVLGEVEDLP